MIVVIGGGFVGQLVQWAIPGARVLDWRKAAPANHLDTRIGPQYLWEPIPGVESHSFPVTTLVDGLPPYPERILAYKRKIGKENDGGDWGLQFQHLTTGYVSYLPVPHVEYAQTVKEVHMGQQSLRMENGSRIDYDILVNTIPLPAFLQLAFPNAQFETEFKHDPIYMQINPSDVPTLGMTLNYISDPDDPIYRVTDTATHRHLESLKPIAGSLTRRITPGKIHAHPETEELLARCAKGGVYSFGRFAAWRPDELAHETWKNIVAWKERLSL